MIPNDLQSDSTGKGPKGWKRADGSIQDEICEILWRSQKVDATEIEVTVENGYVTLSGFVEDRITKREAEDAIENVPGIVDVFNNLEVRNRSSV